MSNKDYAKSIIDTIPDNKLIFLINILESFNNLIGKSNDFDLEIVIVNAGSHGQIYNEV